MPASLSFDEEHYCFKYFGKDIIYNLQSFSFRYIRRELPVVDYFMPENVIFGNPLMANK